MSLLVGFLMCVIIVMGFMSHIGFAMVRTGERIARTATGCTTKIALSLGALCLLSLLRC